MNFLDFLPDDIALCFAELSDWDAELHPLEKDYIRHAVKSRQREYGAARSLARRMLIHFGIDRVPILNNKDRSPIWPEGIVGSISHSNEHCLVALARAKKYKGIGIDIEDINNIDIPIDMILTENEKKQDGIMPLAYFSAKESFYKCQYPRTKRFIDFWEVEIDFLANGTYQVNFVNDELKFIFAMTQFYGYYYHHKTFILTACYYR